MDQQPPTTPGSQSSGPSQPPPAWAQPAGTSGAPASAVQTAERAAAERPEEVAGGKALAVLSYVINFVGVPFFVIPFFMKNNAFALYHSKQAMVLWIAGLIGYLAAGILTITAIGACIGLPLAIATLVTLVIFNIIGLINAINNKAKPVPLVGKYGEEWFASFQKA